MPIVHGHPALHAHTPMGGTVLENGATFRVWAPNAQKVFLLGQDNNFDYTPDWELEPAGHGHWWGFAPGMGHLSPYMFGIIPQGASPPTLRKRDPYARDLTDDPPWPSCHCLLYDPSRFHWRCPDFRPPAFNDCIVYQLHIGTWWPAQGKAKGNFLDVITRLEYLNDLGINTIQFMPIVEFPTMFSLGYNGVDYYSPETDYGCYNENELQNYLGKINSILLSHRKDAVPYTKDDITGTANQFRMLVDMCHVVGLAVILDVVYNHAGGDFDPGSIYFFDRVPDSNQNNSLYFTDFGWAGGLVFAYWNQDVRQFLIDNATYFLTECHADGLRYDEVSVIKNAGGEHGWRFCQDITGTCRARKPQAIQIAECWPDESSIVTEAPNGAGFDAMQGDGLRDVIRATIAATSWGSETRLNLDAVAWELTTPQVGDKWRAVHCLENHDIVYLGRSPRLPRLADPSHAHSWYARSRSRVALGLLLTAPGIPHLFMGQEILEDKPWSDDLADHPELAIYWQGLTDPTVQDHEVHTDFHRFTRELLALRRALPGLRGQSINVFHVHNDNRVLAYHRWVEGSGQDVVIAVNLGDTTHFDYCLGFPGPGPWREVFNSDIYDHWVNPQGVGNAGGIWADTPGCHGLPARAGLTIPANAFVVFTR